MKFFRPGQLIYNVCAFPVKVMKQQSSSVEFEFGLFRVNTLTRQLLRHGAPVPLTSKAFDTLLKLLSEPGRAVSKDELMSAVWPETVVEENNLTQQISTLRKAFGERAGEHRFIVTLPGRGYCFVAPVREVDGLKDHLTKRSAVFDSSFVFGYGLAIVYVLIVCGATFLLDRQYRPTAHRPQSIAILQFRSAGVGDELLGMGIRDTLRAKLGSLEDVTVRPVDPQVPDGDVVQAGRAMNVDVVVTGSIQRDKDRVRVAVEMVDVSGARILWGNTFDKSYSNAFELQDSIATAVASALKRPRVTSGTRRRPNVLDNSTFTVVDRRFRATDRCLLS
jgi:DNA-binding winged helix-turn-helix (wHTH) protein/TolB-like protein